MVRAFHDRLDAPVAVLDPSSSAADALVSRQERVLDELRACDELRNALSARMARLAVVADELQRERDIVRRIPVADTARLVGSQVGFARRRSGRDGAAFVRLAHVLTQDMPQLLKALAAGLIDETAASRIARETLGLSAADRATVDEAIAPMLGQVSVGRLVNAAKEQAYALDAEALRARRLKAEADRDVTVRPAPDQMAWLSALLPIQDALACQPALEAAADQAADNQTSAGTRSRATRAQVKADALVERVTGRSRGFANNNVCVNLPLPADTLLGNTPAHVAGYGPVPADLVREWIGSGDPTGPQLRRLFTHPGMGDIIGMDSRSRRYPGLLARLILFRDQTCRTPWCSSPVRHTDHIEPHAKGGATSAARHAATDPSYTEHTLMAVVWDHNVHQTDRRRAGLRPADDADDTG
ncbi:DUF222 domain-containing protein [Flexivirga caeni]|uniref:DUF222 domain-containing protein n=1 Tax=Flexivirga caeni TaxID=2294115 RepID=A0A3M9MAF7_9MICO|nr:DUF222 domain-containing protein [Flexivirga caeni]RNI22205.1 DUF222 domain-containing protein [Flexivirga caeni]